MACGAPLLDAEQQRVAVLAAVVDDARRRSGALPRGATRSGSASSAAVGPATTVTSSPPPPSSRSSTSTATPNRSLADHREVALDRAEHVARLARAGRGDRLAGGHRDRAGAGVPRRRRSSRRRPRSKVRRGSCTASAASPCTWALVGITADPHALPLRGRRRAASPPATTSRSLGSSTTSAAPVPSDRVEQLAGRGAPSGPAGHDDGAGLGEQLGEPVAGGDHDHRPPGRCGAPSRAAARPARRSG